jgi:hypothetical protein
VRREQRVVDRTHPEPGGPGFSDTDGVSEADVRIEPPTNADAATAVELAMRVLRVKPGDRRKQFAADITDQHGQMFVANANGLVVEYSRIPLWSGLVVSHGFRRVSRGSGLSARCVWTQG